MENADRTTKRVLAALLILAAVLWLLFRAPVMVVLPRFGETVALEVKCPDGSVVTLTDADTAEALLGLYEGRFFKRNRDFGDAAVTLELRFVPASDVDAQLERHLWIKPREICVWIMPDGHFKTKVGSAGYEPIGSAQPYAEAYETVCALVGWSPAA